MKAKSAAPPLNPLLTSALLVASLVVSSLSAFHYLRAGYGYTVFLLWVLTIGTAGFAAYRADGRRPAADLVERAEWSKALLLMLALSPLYIGLIRTIPYQISTDEIAIMMNEAEASAQIGWDIFSLSPYFSFPSFIFVVYGWLGRLLGGIDLASMRSIDAVVGLASVGLFYLVARQFLSSRMSIAAAVLLGTNHALVAISRMAMRNNSALLVVLVGLLFLFRGLRDRRVGWTFVGGSIAGLAFYIYEPARLLFVIWLAWLLAMTIADRTREATTRYARQALFGLVGFGLVVAPLVAASVRATENPEMFDYQREQFLIFPEGRALQQEWMEAPSLVEGVRINIRQGLSAYNSTVQDNGYVYTNRGYGFVDPLTGILLWVGVLWTLSRLAEKRPEDFLFLGGFVILWLTYSFITNKAPNYTRMLITLPFVAYLTLRGIELVVDRLAPWLSKRWPAAGQIVSADLLAGGLVAGIAIWNIGIYADYAVTGLVEHERVGAVRRYIEVRKSDAEHVYYMAADRQNEFIEGGEPWHWEQLIRYFAGDDAWVEVIAPEVGRQDLGPGPFTVFMNREVWEDNAACVTSRYPHRQVHDLTAEGWYLAIEVLQTEHPLTLDSDPCP